MKRIKLSSKARLIRDAIRALHDLNLAYMVEFYRLQGDAATLAHSYALDCSTTISSLGSSYGCCVAWGSVTLSSALGELHPKIITENGRVFCPEAKKIVDKLRSDFAALDGANTAAA